MGEDRLEAIEADITTLRVDAIVNAANAALMPGGGVDGAIRRKAGPELEEELYRRGRCEPGNALITSGYSTPAEYIIHTVAPIFDPLADIAGQERIFRHCYFNSLKLADERAVKSIAFPSIGTGAYRWPADRAAELAIAEVTSHLARGGKQTRVIFCCFSTTDLARYNAFLSKRA
jgi:O-acetyl-ADP-ribose deacetylase (regulator of RNase III)